MRKLTNYFNGRDKTTFTTIESFTPINKGWAFSAIIFEQEKSIGLAKIFHSILSWLFILSSPVTFLVGSIKAALNAVPIMVVLSSIQASINVIPLPIKAIIIACTAKRLKTAQLIFNDLDRRYQRADEHLKIRNCVVNCRRIYYIYCLLYFTYGGVLSLSSLLMRKQPVGLWIPVFDLVTHASVQYYSQFTFEVVYASFLIFCQVNNDCYATVYMRALRTHINLLAERILRLGENPESTSEQNHNELVDCITCHQLLLVLADMAGGIFSITIFAQLAVTATILCVTMLNILIFADTTYQVISVTYYLAVMLQTVPSCYQASMLEADSEYLPLAIFHSNWVGLDYRSRKMLPYFMHRAQKEMSFAAFNLFEINMRTNLSIAKFSFTLYTMMTKLGIDEKIREKFQ